MHKFFVIILTLSVITTPVLPPFLHNLFISTTFAQSDGGDGVSGSGSDNQDYSSPGDNNTHDSAAETPQENNNGAEGEGTSATTTENEQAAEGPSATPTEQVTESEVESAREQQHQDWVSLQTAEQHRADLNEQMQTAISEGRLDDARSLSEQLTAAHQDVNTKEDQYLGSSGVAEQKESQYSAQQERQTAETKDQETAQTNATTSMNSAIEGGASFGDAAMGLTTSGLSADRVGGVIGGLAETYGLTPAEAAAVTASVVASMGGTISAQAGAASIASSSAGGSLADQAAAAQAAENAATGYSGLTAYTATVSSSTATESEKASLISNYGIEKEFTPGEIGQMLGAAGINRDVAREAITVGYNSVGRTEESGMLAGLALTAWNGGWEARTTAGGWPTSLTPQAAAGAASTRSELPPESRPNTTQEMSTPEGRAQAAATAVSAITTPGTADGKQLSLAETRLQELGRFAQRNPETVTNRDIIGFIQSQSRSGGLLEGMNQNQISRAINNGYYASSGMPPGTTNTFGNQVNDGVRGIPNDMVTPLTNPTAPVTQPDPTSQNPAQLTGTNLGIASSQISIGATADGNRSGGWVSEGPKVENGGTINANGQTIATFSIDAYNNGNGTINFTVIVDFIDPNKSDTSVTGKDVDIQRLNDARSIGQLDSVEKVDSVVNTFTGGQR